jgi:hypothetical protein
MRADIRNNLSREEAWELFGDKYVQPSLVTAVSDEFLKTIRDVVKEERA